LMGYFKFCSKCDNKITPKMGSQGMKPNRARRWKYVCESCQKELGGMDAVTEFLKAKFREEGYKHEI
jgi:hypothetical protein